MADPSPTRTRGVRDVPVARHGPRGRSIWWLERSLQHRGFTHVAGVDEAGCGACAGPVVVAAVVLPAYQGAPPRAWADLDDSKLLTPAVRERLRSVIRRLAVAATVVVVPPAEVDRAGVHVADLAAMRRAVAALDVRPDYVLLDGFPVPGLAAPSLAVWKGDRVAACVAAASVLAKVTRDAMMEDLDVRFPGYGFAEHKGYATDRHRDALARLGPTEIHRRSFATVRRVVGARGAAQCDAGGGE